MKEETQASVDERYMRMALDEAVMASDLGEVPVGAVIVYDGDVIARAHNLTERLGDPTAHAEMLAITMATDSLGGKYLSGCILYVTVEPCAMCAAAIGWSQISRIVYGVTDEKRGYNVMYARSPFHPRANVTAGVLAEESRSLMQDFFRKKRRK